MPGSRYTLPLHLTRGDKFIEFSGLKRGLRSVGPGLVAQETVMCGSCKGSGRIFKEKDRCKKCRGERITEARTNLEVYIPRGSKYVTRISFDSDSY